MENTSSAPARIYSVVPCDVGLHCAEPFWSTVANGATFPIHVFGVALGALVNSPTHHFTSLPVSVTGDGGLLNVPMAANCAWPLAVAGLIFTLCSCRLLPQLKAARERSKRGPTERERSPVTVHLRTKFDAGGMNPYTRQVARGSVNSTSAVNTATTSWDSVINGKAS